jgi:esterase/lipase
MEKTDPFISEDEAREFYDRIAIDDKKLKFYDSGHELPTEYIKDVISWITQHNKKKVN